MRLIADTNRIMASLIKDSVSRKILQSPHLKFATISFGDKEILKYKKVIENFEKQDKVKIWKTKDLLDYIKSQ